MVDYNEFDRLTGHSLVLVHIMVYWYWANVLNNRNSIKLEYFQSSHSAHQQVITLHAYYAAIILIQSCSLIYVYLNTDLSSLIILNMKLKISCRSMQILV